MARADHRGTAVWDLPTRLFHWALVLLMATLVVTGKTGRMDLHALTGEAVLVLVLFRLAWGFVGSETSRFASFLAGPRRISDYLRRGGGNHHLGHNPLGGWMVVALLGMVLLQGGMGLFTNDDILFDGPLSHLVAKGPSDRLTGLHKQGFWVLAAMVGLHLGAILFHGIFLRDNLVQPMITGRKRLPRHMDGVVFVGSLRAVAVLVFAITALWALLRLA